MVHSGAMAPIRVFLLDDHEVVRQGLLRLIEADPDMTVVGEAATAHEALVRVPRSDADVALLDVRLPDGSGVEVCRELASLAPGVRCLMLTSYEDDDALLAAITAGAAGYVLKEIRGPQLLDSIRLVAAGRSPAGPGDDQRVLDRVRETHQHDARLDLLTAQESAVLDLIGEGLTNREIADRMFLAEKTVKNYISSLLAKIEVRGRTQAALFIAEQRHRRPGSASRAGSLGVRSAQQAREPDTPGASAVELAVAQRTLDAHHPEALRLGRHLEAGASQHAPGADGGRARARAGCGSACRTSRRRPGAREGRDREPLAHADRRAGLGSAPACTCASARVAGRLMPNAWVGPRPPAGPARSAAVAERRRPPAGRRPARG